MKHPLALATGQGGHLRGRRARPGRARPAPRRRRRGRAGSPRRSGRDVRRAAEQHVVGDRDRRRGRPGSARPSATAGEPARAPASWPRRDTVDRDAPHARDQPGDGAQQRRLAGAVRADDADPLAGGRRSSDTRRRRAPPSVTADVLGDERRSRCARAVRAQHEDEERRADERGDDADRHLGRASRRCGRPGRRATRNAARRTASTAAGSRGSCARPAAARCAAR